MSTPFAKGPLLILLGALCFSTTGTVQALSPEGATPYVIGALRMLVGGLALLLWCAFRGELPRFWRWPMRCVVPSTLALLGFQFFFFRGVLEAGVAEQPAVRRAAANVRDCWLALQRTTVLSPAAGQIAKRGVQAGEVVSPGTPLMTVIPLHRLWIDANFKEVQLHKMRIGQPAVIRVDMYGGDVTYHGRVTGFSAGTGSAFSLLPPQNATGNWIKIVQRVPVRIEIDPADLREHPLLVGLSAVVKVDTSDTSGRLLAASARTEPVPGDLVSQAPAVDFAPVEATISGIIRDNALPGVCPVQGKP